MNDGNDLIHGILDNTTQDAYKGVVFNNYILWTKEERDQIYNLIQNGEGKDFAVGYVSWKLIKRTDGFSAVKSTWGDSGGIDTENFKGLVKQLEEYFN